MTKPANQPRTESAVTSSHQDATSCQWFSCLASPLDRRSAVRLVWLFIGAILACGRRTVTSWIRVPGLSRQYQPCYTTVAAAGKRADNIAGRLIHEVVKPLVDGQTRLTVALTTRRHSGMGPPCRGLASITTRPPARLARRMSTATSGWCSGSWRSILHGESSLCRCWPVCTCGPRICRASTQSIGRSSGPSWRWKSTPAVGLVLAPVPGQAAVGGGRRGLRQGPVPQTGDVAGNDGRQPAARTRRYGQSQGPGYQVGAVGRGSTERRHRLGQTGRAASRLDD